MKLRSFEVKNFRSIKSAQKIDFNLENKNVDIFIGPNNSGKSNIFRAMAVLKLFIQNSTTYNSNREQIVPFLFDMESNKKPTVFAIEMQINKHVYQYKFSYFKEKIVGESLKRSALKKKLQFTTIFSRLSMDKNTYEEYGFDRKILKSTRKDSLVLTKAYENNNKIAIVIFNWLSHLQFMTEGENNNLTASEISEDDEFKDKVLELLRRADINIQDLSSVKENIPDEYFDDLPIYKSFKSKLDRTRYNVTTTHLVYDNDGKIVTTKTVPLSIESTGTNRLFELAYPILDTLRNGNILYIDEFEIYLHPRECRFIIELFMSEENTNNSQLIINTHNTQLMDVVGRDGVHLVGKNSSEETIIGSISKSIRSDDPLLEKKYSKGMFGAVPRIKE